MYLLIPHIPFSSTKVGRSSCLLEVEVVAELVLEVVVVEAAEVVAEVATVVAAEVEAVMVVNVAVAESCISNE